MRMGVLPQYSKYKWLHINKTLIVIKFFRTLHKIFTYIIIYANAFSMDIRLHITHLEKSTLVTLNLQYRL